MKKPLLYFTCFMVILVMAFSCSKTVTEPVVKPVNVTAARNWLLNSNELYAREAYSINFPDGTHKTIRLNWDKARQVPWKGQAFIDIPYDMAANSGTHKFSLVLQDLGNNDYRGAIRVDNEDPNAKVLGTDRAITITTQTYTHLNGNKANMWIRQGVHHDFVAASYEMSTPAEAGRKDAALRAANTTMSGTVARSASSDPCSLVEEKYQTLELCGPIPTDPSQLRELCFVTHTRLVLQCEKTDELTNDPEYPPVDNGGGGDGNATNTTNDSTRKNPCDSALKFAASVNNIADLQATKNKVTAMGDLASLQTEKGFATLARMKVNPHNNNEATIDYFYTSPMATGTDSSIVIDYSHGDLDVVVAMNHSHPAKGAAPPSPPDVFEAIDSRLNDNLGKRLPDAFVGNFIYAADGSVYSLVVTSPLLAAEFFTTKAANLEGRTWNLNSNIGKVFSKVSDAFEKQYKRLSNKKNLVFEAAMAYVLSSFDTGVTLLKKDATTGTFKPIIRTAVKEKNWLGIEVTNYIDPCAN